ncbi:MAG: family 10 glycosylhydrolase [Vicinamibacterales bacterium]
MRLPLPSGAMLRRACAIAVCFVLSPAAFHAVAPAPEPAPTRALWVTRTTLSSREAIQQMVLSAEAGGFNTLMVQVRARGDAYFNSTLEPRAPEVSAKPGFDPLATTLELAHAAGLRVHAWVSVNLVSSAASLPAAREHVIYRSPEWLMVPKELAAQMRTVDVRSPAYIGQLARWTRAHANDVEGLYTSPIVPAAADYTTAVIADLAKNYAIDGVHLDYARYPNETFDYSAAALDQFKLAIRPNLTATERQEAATREVIDPLAYPNLYRTEWDDFRRSRLTALVMRIRSAVRAVRPGAVFSAAVVPDAQQAFQSRLQDWRTWLDESLLDVLCPMAYTTDADVFQQQIAAAKGYAGDRPVWAGIGAYRLTTPQTVQNVATALRLGASGVILFSYDALTAPPNSVAAITELGRAAFAAGPEPR